MTKRLLIGMIATAFLGCGEDKPAKAPPAKGGVEVKGPGVNIKVDDKGTEVKAPGVEVKTKKD